LHQARRGGHGIKKFVVKVKQRDTERTIKYGDANMEIKRDNPERRKAERRQDVSCIEDQEKVLNEWWLQPRLMLYCRCTTGSGWHGLP